MASDSSHQLHRPVHAPTPLRVLLTAAATAAWYDISDNGDRERVVERLQEVCQGWIHKPGVQFLTSVDDDLFLVGDPRGFQRWSIYVILDVDELDTVVSMIDDFRHGQIKLNRYFTMNATIGRPFWPIEQNQGP
jgi:hypothetical protein